MRAANSVSGFCLLRFFLLCQSKANAYFSRSIIKFLNYDAQSNRYVRTKLSLLYILCTIPATDK